MQDDQHERPPSRSTPPEADRTRAAEGDAEALAPATETNVEARVGSRGDASGRNLEQARAIGEDDPLKGSVAGRRAFEGGGFPKGPSIGTDAVQLEEARREER